ncbi:MAG: hypothetical protein BGO68_05600 [Candidatus Amoebophilus sp. 36-38]|nr:MAG: hypothetical protein BGO68_05600 [Candidatus Amoebophilus sp. 36-38]
MAETEIYTTEAEPSTKTADLSHTRPDTQQVNEPRIGLILFLLLLLLCSIAILLNRRGKSQIITLEGQRLGKEYKIQYKVIGNTNYQDEIDSLLNEVEQTLDSYIEDSEVARFNHYTCEPFYYNSPLFYPLLAKSKAVYAKTQGAFDPTVAPLVDLWKKKLKKGIEPNYFEIQPLREYVGLDYIVVNEDRVKRLKEGVKIDLSSIIPSYGIDLVSNFLQSKDIKDLCIELGNEALGIGLDGNKKPWQVIRTITDDQTISNPFSVHIKLSHKAFSIAKKHTPWEMEQNMRIVIDPQTGYLPTGNILAAFVFADDCITASAYATAFITKNFTTALEMLTKIEGIEAFFIYKKNAEEIAFYHTQGLKIEHQEGSQEINIQTSP